MKVEEQLDLTRASVYEFPRNTLCKNIKKHWKCRNVPLHNSSIRIDHLMLQNGRIHHASSVTVNDIIYLVIHGIVYASMDMDKHITIDPCDGVELTDAEKAAITAKLEAFYDQSSKFVAEQRAFFDKNPHATIVGLTVNDAIQKLTDLKCGWEPPPKKTSRDDGYYYDSDDSDDSDDD